MNRTSDSADVRIGVDLGGTKIELLALGPDATELHRERIATPRNDYAAIVHAVRDLVLDAETRLATRASVGVGTPGALSPTSGVMRNANTTCLNGRPLDRALCDELAREGRISHGANCFALSEAVDGAARDARVVFGVIVGTGTGGGVVIDRRPLIGRNAIAGEWGHNPLPWPTHEELPGPPCYCGKRGCIETFLSGPGIAHDHAERCGERIAAIEIAARAERGDGDAERTLERHADRMARALASVINVLDPDAIVLGGGVSLIGSLPEAIHARLPNHVFSDRVTTPVVRAVHGDAGGVRGAAWLWPSESGA
ncbi:MAG: ROK family protein [Myxococcales bacterium]|nr:ROK family protein [Myxococcales bacterium]